MRIHLLAIDLDGTLLTSEKKVSPATAEAIALARSAGVHIVLATARPPRTVLPFYRRLGLDAPMINYNGALVYDPPGGRVIMHRPIGVKAAGRIIALAREVYPEVAVSAEILDNWYTDRLEAELVTETSKLLKPDLIAPIRQWLTQSVTKLLMIGQPQRLMDVAKSLYGEFLHQISIVQTDQCLLQIMHSTVSKAQALRVVAGEYSVSREQVMAIGDNANDVGMLDWAGLAVAMSNSVPDLLKVADDVTADNDSDGVAHAIQKHILDHRPK